MGICVEWLEGDSDGERDDYAQKLCVGEDVSCGN